MTVKKFREQLRNGEALAIRHNPKDAKRSRADIMDLFGEPVRVNEECDGYTVMYIHGPLEQRDGWFGDSYENIRRRFGEALKSKNECIVIRVDSPGGVVAGLNQCVYDMIRAKESSGKHVIVYCDELTASAAYAITCVADEVYLPPSGIMGSIGVISTMFDTTGADEKAGLNFVTITSGERKADGHPHQPLEDDAIAIERDRVEKLAAQFFRIVQRSRGIDAAPLQAGLFLGKDAVTAGLADEVAGWERLLIDIQEVYGSAQSGTPAQTGTTGTPGKPTSEADMLKLKAMIKRVSAQLAKEEDVNKRAKLAAQLGAFESTLSAYKKTYKKTEEEETEEGGEDEEEEEGGNETDRDEDDMPGDDDDDKKEEEDDAPEKKEEDDSPEKKDEDKKEKKSKSESEEEEESEEDDSPDKDALSTPGKRAAVLAKARAYDAMQGDVAFLKNKDARKDKLSAISDARKANRITAKHAKMLESKGSKFVSDFLAMHKTPMVFSGEEPGTIPDDTGPRSHGDIPPSVMRQFVAASQASKGSVTIDQLVSNYKKELNGGASR